MNLTKKKIEIRIKILQEKIVDLQGYLVKLFIRILV